MPETQTNQNIEPRGLNWKLSLPICFLILLAASGFTYYIYTTEPTAERTTATRQTAMLVELTTAEKGNYRPIIIGRGSVEASRDIILSPRVSGEVIEISDNFSPGEYAKQGDTLLRIDPADYENTLEQQKSNLQQAKADLEIERGLQDVAQEEYDMLNENLTLEDQALVLRKPQMNSIQAAIQSAEAAVNQARLELQRTHIKAPFDAQILSRNVNLGSQVAPGDNLARLVGIDEYWVIATVPLSKLQWIQFSENENNHGSPAFVRNRTAWPENAIRSGHVNRLIGALDEQTRLARVLVTIPDPLSLQNENNGPPLIIGSYVEAQIEGREMTNVIRLNRDYLHQDDTVWTMEEGKLRIKEVTIPFRDAQYAYITEGLTDGAQVVTTNLATVVEGSPLRTESVSEEGSSE